MTIKYTDNSKQMIKWLRRNHGLLEMASADTLNAAAENIENEYRRALRTHYIIKNKFTLGSIKTFPATARRKSGEMRPITGINAITGIRKMKGGKDHYMKSQEEGARISGTTKAENRVPIPLASARSNESKTKPIAIRYRMIGGQAVQTLRLGGAPFGYNDKFNARQRWAILYKYTKNKSGKFDTSRPFIFEGEKRGLGIFVKKGARIRMIRILTKSSVKIRARHTFENSLKVLTNSRMERIFMSQARKYVK